MNLMEEIIVEELTNVLHNFQKDKSPGSDGWPIEFFLETFENIGVDLLKVVEESRVSGKILATFNSTFIDLIPKVDNHVSFDGFGPISLANGIYKVVAKSIAKCIKVILSKHISSE